MPVTEKFLDQTINFRISTRVLERLRRAASAREMPMGQFMRAAIVAEITRFEQGGELGDGGAQKAKGRKDGSL